jgi:signal transduction histidine kinase
MCPEPSGVTIGSRAPVLTRLRPSPAGRRLLAWFIAATVLPVSGLAWLAQTVIDQDRSVERTRVEEHRNQALGVATAALQRTLAETEERLTEIASVPDRPPRVTGVFAKESGVTIVIFDRHGLVARAGTPLPYYPAVAARPVTSAAFARADAAEFGKGNPLAAIELLRPLTDDRDGAVRGQALLRLARNYRKAGDSARALAAYDALESLAGTQVDDRAAGLVARQGRALLRKAAGRAEDVQHEGSRLRSDLDDGRWTLSRTQYEFARHQAVEWIGGADNRTIDDDRLALADAADAAWRIWSTSRSEDLPDRQRRTLRTGHGPTLMSWRATPERLVVLVAGTRFLRTCLADVRRLGPGVDVDIALTDGDGELVIGQADAPASRQSVQSPSLTSLPWTVHAISRDSLNANLSRSAQLVLALAVLGALMLVASAYLISRAIARELSVAALQTDFVAAVSHEFRTPLTTIRQLSEMLTRGRVSTLERRQQFYETLLRESNRLNRLVEELLDFGRMEARALEYHFDDIDPESLVRQVVAEFQEEVAPAGFVIDLHVSSPMPHIRADKGSLWRVIWNLLDNAAKYSPDHRAVRVHLEHTDGDVLVHVRDQGMGIPRNEQASIFGRFVRGTAAKVASIKGTGLGLAMARQIVESHGGRLTVDSAEGLGSTFTVHLPVAERT